MDGYAALAQRVVLTMGDVHGCLVLSRDGLILAAYPEESEEALKPAWLRFVSMGEVKRSFVEFGDQLWGFVHRGPYAAFVVAGVGVRPGIILDQLEQALLLAEDGRSKRDTFMVPDAAAAPSGKPRTSLHPPADKPAPAEVAAVAPLEPVVAEAFAPPVEVAPPVEAIAAPIEAPPIEPAPVAEAAPIEPEPPAAKPKKKLEKLMSSAPEPAPEEAGEIDRVLLAKEFSGLLQLDSDGDEGSS
jgi:hypothetical protein